MPELPEVEILRKYFKEVALNQDIEKLEFHDHLDKIFATPREVLNNSLCGDHFTTTRRVGKYLFAKLSKGKWLHLHFGMTGDLQLLTASEDLPKYTRFVILFKDGERLAFRDLRKFGVIELVEDPMRYQKDRGIGPDLLEIDPNEFSAGFRGRKAPIKALLLQQDKVAGIGNWIADEMLFNAGIHPSTRAERLSDEELQTLYQEAIKIVKKAIKHDTHYGDFPKEFFVNYRSKGVLHPDYPNSPVEALKVGGRGTYIVPERQVLR